MKLEDLDAFVHVARQGGFSRAATELRIAQSALSRRVLRLEHELGVRLLTRHGRGVRPTEHGIALLDRACGLMAELQSIERDLLASAGEPSGNVRIALPPTTAQVMVPLIVAELRRRFPRIRLHVREGFSGSIHDWVVEGKVDLAVLYNPEPSADLQITPFLREPLYLVAASNGPELPAKAMANGQVRLKRLDTLPLILPSRSHSLRTLLERLAAEHRFSLQVVNEIDGMRATKGMIEAGLGYTVFSYAGVYEEVSAGTLKMIPFLPQLRWQLALVEKSGAASRALIEIKRLVAQQIHVLLERGFWQGELCHAVAHSDAAAPQPLLREVGGEGRPHTATLTTS